MTLLRSHLVQYPNRPFYRPYDLPVSARVKPKNHVLELAYDVPSEWNQATRLRSCSVLDEESDGPYALCVSRGRSALRRRGPAPPAHQPHEVGGEPASERARLSWSWHDTAGCELTWPLVLVCVQSSFVDPLTTYAIGTIQGNELHLTPVHGVFQVGQRLTVTHRVLAGMVVGPIWRLARR